MRRKIIFWISILLFLSLFFARAGDFFLLFLGNKLHINTTYKNHAGFFSCFILRSMKLDGPVFRLEDFGIEFKSFSAVIKPDFRELINKKKITLESTIKDASFLNIDGNIDFDFPRADVSALLKKLLNIQFDTMNTTLIVYGKTVEFPEYAADSKDVKLIASGFITEDSAMDISLRILFSPEMVSQFPEELRNLLTEEPHGWYYYYLRIETGKEKSFFKLDSDRLKVNFEKIETK